jgi:hypothetical protein
VIQGYHLSFPVLQVALFMAVTTSGLPYLARGVQRLIKIFIALVALASAVGGHGLPVNVLGSLAIGWGVTAVVRLIFGSPLGLPSARDVGLLLAELGIRGSNVHPVSRQVWGVAKYEATEIRKADSPGQHIAIEVYGRDAADARLLTKAGRFLLYRDSGPSLTISRLQQVEHEAYLTMRAGRAGVAVPEIIEAGTAGPSKDALVVCRLPAGTTLSQAGTAGISDVMLDDLHRQLLTLRGARIAHGAISGDTLLVDPAAETVVLADFRNASAAASPDLLDRDLADAIAATAVAVGAERAADAAARFLTPRSCWQAARSGGTCWWPWPCPFHCGPSTTISGFPSVLIVVITLAAMIGGIAPVAGGIGVVEAGMILGLTAAGVTEADATAPVFIQRLFSSYLPPIWRWATLVWMRKREYL